MVVGIIRIQFALNVFMNAILVCSCLPQIYKQLLASGIIVVFTNGKVAGSVLDEVIEFCS
jgi:hypothetical protein